MDQPAQRPEAPAPRALSERVRLAWAAREAALAVPGVAATDAGPLGLHVTRVGDGERMEGVTCVATHQGEYSISLRLICEPVPLHPLAEEISVAVRASVSQAGLADVLDGVSIHFADLAEDGR